MFTTLYSALYDDDCHPFNQHYPDAKIVCAGEPEHLTDTEGALIVWGGSDIEPALYGHPKGKGTYTSPKRCAAEWALMQRARDKGIAIIGVCRGAQMLCALAGGYLLQHVENHHGWHMVETPDGKRIRVNSIHHQMMAGLEEVDHELLAWADHRRSEEYLYKADELFPAPPDFKEPEFVYFPKVRGFAVQWHPEMMEADEEATLFVVNEINSRS